LRGFHSPQRPICLHAAVLPINFEVCIESPLDTIAPDLALVSWSPAAPHRRPTPCLPTRTTPTLLPPLLPRAIPSRATLLSLPSQAMLPSQATLLSQATLPSLLSRAMLPSRATSSRVMLPRLLSTATPRCALPTASSRPATGPCPTLCSASSAAPSTSAAALPARAKSSAPSAASSSSKRTASSSEAPCDHLAPYPNAASPSSPAFAKPTPPCVHRASVSCRSCPP
ncbi:uncharacterized protein BJ171DRAFT_138749, partial [Polychytrium aggregatum]|uniref:uncharacterized protein n=1 Tax=Polychytrium aggregatum TaxID=110093 RepID=UPI0022FEF040